MATPITVTDEHLRELGGKRVTYGSPHPDIQSLQVQRFDADSISLLTRWKFTDEERAMIAAGKPLELRIIGPAFVPVHLSVESAEDCGCE